jgi:hypothetical protein
MTYLLACLCMVKAKAGHRTLRCAVHGWQVATVLTVTKS